MLTRNHKTLGPTRSARLVSDRDIGATCRARLLDLSVGFVDDLQCARHDRSPEDFCHDYQVCLPYRGLAIWHVGNEDVVADATQVIFVRGGEAYRMSGPVAGGYAELIITPDKDLLAEIVAADGKELFDHPLFRDRSGRASPYLQTFRARYIHWVTGLSSSDDLNAEELLIALLNASLRRRQSQRSCGAATARLIRRAKEYLEADLSNRIRLADVARVVGTSPAYLTDVFRRFEGASLHQYLTQLRLARALTELSHADNLTTLALETGFSSHSHFSAVFRRTFGITPSQFRETTRRRLRP